MHPSSTALLEPAESMREREGAKEGRQGAREHWMRIDYKVMMYDIALHWSA
jgi:hypothetical protein